MTGTLLHLGQLPPGAQARLLAEYAKEKGGTIIYVATHEAMAEALMETARFFALHLEILAFPAWDCLPYDRVSPSAGAVATRMTTLATMLQAPRAPRIICTTIQAISQKLPPKELLDSHIRTLHVGETIPRDDLLEMLIACGFSRVSKVVEPGEFALRGSIVDIFTAGDSQAYRLDFFGDELESIRQMDAASQRSGDSVSSIMLLPIREVLLTEESIARFRNEYRERFGTAHKGDPLYEHISEGQTHAGMEHYLGLFYETLSQLSDYAENIFYCIDHRAFAALDDHQEAINDYYHARTNPVGKQSHSYHPPEPELLYLNRTQMDMLWRQHPATVLSPFTLESSATHINLPFKAAPNLKLTAPDLATSPLDAFALYAKQHAQPIVVACNSEGSRHRFETMLTAHNVAHAVIESHLGAQKLPPHVVGLAVLPMATGFTAPDITLFSEQDILGERVIRTQKKCKQSEVFLLEAASFDVGELVVHREHGIGKFEGLITVDVTGVKHDCIKLTYDGGDRLFLPVENIELITRYGSEHEHAELDKLGGVAWQKRKSALKKKLKMAADSLLKIAAARAAIDAPTVDTVGNEYQRFCMKFPYTETEDQLRAIDEVIADLQTGRVMDRLVCGDVGFGKTEVAMRAIFAMVEQGYQVAMIVPTTLLARQHFQNFRERFHGFTPRIGQLSRMVTPKEMKEVRENLANGKIDVVIGTHALLAEGIAFKNLGMVVIDEEQHFGVKQKERLKEFKEGVHVLTLSATPIPRTLQLALSGIRELSLITTPPLDRLAVRSVVMPFDSVIIRDAIMREKHRGGRTFYVTPRIQYMADLEKKLAEIVPEVSVAVAHGQMTPTKLDTVMNDFCDGKHDVLLSTAIIESGIDIPSANTMIIDHPELFGLSQLYQIRGRVGRGKVRAHAYFTLPTNRTLTHNATRRLEVMQQLDHLGAGFAVASHDMDIRGFGNVLGEEQSGHIREVGIELYQAMLEEAIEEMKHKRLKGEDSSRDWSPQINIGMPVLIPESYIEDLSLRLSLYRRAGVLEDDAQIDDFAIELTDRFGTPPDEVSYLLEVMRLKIWCKLANIAKLDAGEKAMVVAFHKNSIAQPEKLIDLIASAPSRYKLRADQTVLINQPTSANAARLQTSIDIVKLFAGMNA